MSTWFVVQTRPHGERLAEINLKRQGYDVWLPRFRKVRRHARRVDHVLAPLFPGYLFLQMDPSIQPWRAINGTFGVRGILCRDNRPQALPAGFVEDLKSRADADGGAFPLDDGVQVGSDVRIASGPFEDCVGTVLKMPDKERVMVLLKILGREVQAVMARHDVLPAGA